ncbi:Translational activator GCN1 [Hordeum vulgare]|nr:Translational activator GCN1 [Hordeum vulgare]
MQADTCEETIYSCTLPKIGLTCLFFFMELFHWMREGEDELIGTEDRCMFLLIDCAMRHIFSLGLATRKHDMGSGEPLGSPMPDFPATPDIEVIDDPNKHFKKPFDKPFDPVHHRKRKRGGLMEEEINVFCSMTGAVKEVATTIGSASPSTSTLTCMALS